MIIVKVMGGLGNQMFQIAFAKAVALEIGEEIFIDTSAYKKYKIRNYSASNLYIDNSIKNIEAANITLAYKGYLNLSQKIYRIFQKIIMRSLKRGEAPYKLLSYFGLYYNFDVFYYSLPSLSFKRKIKCIYGYFQSEKYFEKYKELIKNEMKVKTSMTTREKRYFKEIKDNNSVAVSMRLGDDYVKSKSLNVCNDDYYYKAMDSLYNKNPNVVFYIFSDNIERAKKNYNFKYPVKYIENFNDYESLRLMYTCKHFIISNSSFSWWGAYLSDNNEKTILSPNKWYNQSIEPPDIYFDKMVLIDVTSTLD